MHKQVVFVTVVSVYTKLCVVVARYSNAVPYFHGVLSVCRPFPPTVVTSAQKATSDPLSSTQAKMPKDKLCTSHLATLSGGRASAASRPRFHIKRPRTVSS